MPIVGRAEQQKSATCCAHYRRGPSPERGYTTAPPLLLPQQRHLVGEIEQGASAKQWIIENGFDDVRRKTGQCHHPPDVTLVELLRLGDFPARRDLARLQHGKRASTVTRIPATQGNSIELPVWGDSGSVLKGKAAFRIDLS